MIKHAKQPQDNLILKPEFAYRLISCLSIAFVFGVLGAITMYFYASTMSEASVYRKDFNNGYTQSRDYFEKNEVFLSSIIKNIEFTPGSTVPLSNLERRNFYSDFFPSLDDRKGGLVLSAQIRKDLREAEVSIIYLDSDLGFSGYAFKAGINTGDKFKEIFENLKGVDWKKEAGNGLQVFQLGTGSEKKSYIFEPVSPRLMPNVWLGLELPHSRVQESITSGTRAAPELGIKYLILDKNLKYVSGIPELDLSQRSTRDFLKALNSKSDGFEIHSNPVFKVSLKKELGGGQRWLVYYASYRDVFWQIRYSIAFGVLTLIVSILSAYIVMRYVRRAVFLPAQEQAMQLLEREAFNRTMLDLAPVGICVFSRDSGELLLQSERAKTMLASYVEVEGSRISLREFFMSIPPAEGDAIYRTEVTTFTTNENTQRYIRISMVGLQYNDQPVLFISFVDDSERRRAELILASAKEAADEANTAKSTFLAMMSHEIRTPLYGVLGTLELLANTTLLPQQQGYLSTIEHSSGNLLNIIDDILDFSKVEANQLTLDSAPFNIVELTEGVAKSFVSLAHKKGVELHCYLQPDLPLLAGDRNRLQQVLNNLVSNAVKFTDSGKIVIRIKGTENASGMFELRIQVSDSGIGICKTSQAKLFEPFIQADNSTARRFGGTGLGLSICHKLTELMGGKIELVSALGLGSSFTLLLELPVAGKLKSISLAGLPAVQVFAGSNEQRESLLSLIEHAGGQAESITQMLTVSAHNDLLLAAWSHREEVTCASRFAGVIWLDPQGAPTPEWRDDGWHVSSLSQQGILQALQLAARNEPGVLGTSPVILPSVLKRLHVLAVEDHPINQLVMTEQLEQLGCQVTMTSDGHEALQRWHHGESFDVVLTDVSMPELDGYELTRRLRAEGVQVPIVGVTANAQADEGERCFQAGMDGYLAKPVSLAELKRELLRIGGLP